MVRTFTFFWLNVSTCVPYLNRILIERVTGSKIGVKLPDHKKARRMVNEILSISCPLALPPRQARRGLLSQSPPNKVIITFIPQTPPFGQGVRCSDSIDSEKILDNLFEKRYNSLKFKGNC